ncbi:hypothetical protein SSX86_019881 [Deinandra increscens subsp. villosa]|uniref:FAF domain-containing protein n=1 Tax=Deinandra increscens subsp. villosa TaxID=3103831 RepID=A0AAP0CYJ6_9ASTR
MQGIVSILRSDNPEKTTKAAPLRRTLSADMSSKKWFADSGLPVMKKIASSEQIAIDSFSSSSESDEEECKVKGVGDKNPSRTDIWSAIMSQKKQDDSVKLPPPYVHPLVKKSASSLSEKSLKVCTESLGSETGSDVFASQPSSESEKSDSDNGCEKEELKVVNNPTYEKEEHKVVRFPSLTTKKPQPVRSFPPPLPSLAAARTDGPSFHVHSHRVDGRLVLEAVSVQQQKYFEAQRQDGRFLLTLINDPKEPQPPSEHERDLDMKQNSEHDNNDIDDKAADNEKVTDLNIKDIGILRDRPLNSTTTMVSVHKSQLTTKRILDRDNENRPWSRKPNTKEPKTAKLEAVEEEDSAVTESPPMPRSRGTGLPPLPRPAGAGAASVNSYQYFWRAKPTVASVIDPLITQHRPPTKTKDLVLLRGNKADSFQLKCCKEPRRTVLMWEPFCIATS